MTHPDAERWNARYVANGEARLEDQPRQLLLDYAHLIPKQGIALDAAAGVANNGTFLARRGMHVIALDISITALQLATRRAQKESLHLSAAVYDLSHLWLPMNHFDVIVNFHFLERATFPVFRQALRAGGLIIFETFLRSNEDTSTPDFYLEPGELQNAFPDFKILHLRERIIPANAKVTVQLVARKPAF